MCSGKRGGAKGLYFVFLFFPLPTGSGGGAGTAAFCTPSSFARSTNDMPPAALFTPRTTDVSSRKAPEGSTGCTTCEGRA